jgi:hypothetical protein
MKLLQIFNKTPNYKKFNYAPRFYNPEEEERQERIRRIQQEVDSAKAEELAEKNKSAGLDLNYRDRIHGSFSKARQANGNSERGAVNSTSPALLRMTILLVLTVGFIGYLQYGKIALYGIALVLIPIFLYLKFRKVSTKGR